MHCVLLTHAPAFSASQFVLTKKTPRIYTSVHSVVFELTELTYTSHKEKLIRHRRDRHNVIHCHRLIPISHGSIATSCPKIRSLPMTLFTPLTWTLAWVDKYHKTWNTHQLRLRICEIASCVWYSDRAHCGVGVFMSGVGRRLPFQLQCSYISVSGVMFVSLCPKTKSDSLEEKKKEYLWNSSLQAVCDTPICALRVVCSH